MLNYLVIGESALNTHRMDLHRHATFSCGIEAFGRKIAALFRG